MLNISLSLALHAAFAPSTPADVPACTVKIGELVQTPEVARGIAEAIISGRQSPEVRARYELIVERDEDDPAKWAIWQALPEPPPPPPGMIQVQGGGGGMFMRIDRCTGEVSDVHYIR